MPEVTVRKRGDKYRLVDKGTGRISKTVHGKARDGGGHKNKSKAGRQKGYVNEGMKKADG
jgi:hypothetical protein